MKKAKIINGIFWTIVWICLSVAVCIGWHKNGCPASSLVLGCVMYGVFCFCFGACINEAIKEILS